MRSRAGWKPGVVAGSSLGAGLDRPWLRIGEGCVDVVGDGVGPGSGSGSGSCSGSGSGSGSQRPRDRLERILVRELLLGELLIWDVSVSLGLSLSSSLGNPGNPRKQKKEQEQE